MGKNEKDLVGSRKAGTATFNQLIDESMTKLLIRHDLDGVRGRPKVAFIDLENKSAEDLGDFEYQLQQVIETVGENSGRYRMIANRYVETALREIRVRPEQVMIPKYMRKMAQILEQNNNPVDFLLYAVLTSGTTEGVASRQRDYILSMELINVRTGDLEKESSRLRKEYVKG